MKPFRSVVPHLVALIGAVLMPSVALAQEKPNPKLPNGIAATVNGRVITKNEVALLLTPTWTKLNKRFPDRGPEYERLVEESRKQVIQDWIDRRNLIDQVNQPKVQITPEAIQEELQREIRDNYQGSADMLREALKSCRMTMEGFRDILRDRLTARELQRRQLKAEQE